MISVYGAILLKRFIKMSLNPALEDMKEDELEKLQLRLESQMIEEHKSSTPSNSSEEPSAPPPYSPSSLPYPIAPEVNSSLYPKLSEFMNFEFSSAVIAANMPEYLTQNSQSIDTQIATIAQGESVYTQKVIVPLSVQPPDLQPAKDTSRIREVILCKDVSGKVGLRLIARNNGIHVSSVSKESPAAMCNIRFGDQVLQVNNVNVAGFSKEQIHDLFHKSGVNGIKVLVCDRPLERPVTLQKDGIGNIGIQFKNGKIIGLVQNSSSTRNGLLTEHHLLEVDGHDVVGLSDQEIYAIIEAAPKVVTVKIIPSLIYKDMVKNKYCINC
ncbi:syntenin-1-like isoform X3 [Lycorma delicatula]|uniref:syntenin-1-like isoform X3 n=1 Tax=Lycorma delicatula TaxID=130591 RepID=UPI003F50E379